MSAHSITSRGLAGRKIPQGTLTPIGTLLFSASEQGAWDDQSDISTLFQDEARTLPVTAVEQPLGCILDKSGRGNHATQATTTKRPVYSRRVNLHRFSTENFSNAGKLKAGTGLEPVVTPNYAPAPDGSMSAVRVQLDSGGGTTGTDYSILSDGFVQVVQQAGVAYTTKVWLRATGSSAQVSIVGAGTVYVTVTLDSTWRLIELNETGVANGSFTLRLASSGGLPVRGSQDFLIWHPSLTLSTDAHLPYQWVNTATDYDADPSKFPAYRRLDGVDDSHASATGGGGTAGFFFSSTVTPLGGAGTARTLFSDAGANSGYIVRLNASNQLELAAGNGTAYTTVATAGTLAVGTTNVIQAWDDGANLNVKIGNGPTASIARPAVSAGTAGYTMGQDNGASTGYFNGRIYSTIYRKDSGLTQVQREAVALYQRQKARMP